MDRQRAKEISSSLGMVNVVYNGDPIYIEQVNENKETASVHTLDEPAKSQEVPLSKLQEH